MPNVVYLAITTDVRILTSDRNRINIVQTIPPKSKTLKVMIKIAVIFKI